jgi:antirestriction protein ArdC
MNVRDIITEQFINALKEGTVPWRRPWSIIRPMNVEGRFYTGINRFLLSFLDYPDPRYITKRKCLEMGGWIKNEEFRKSHIVVFYKNYNDKDDDSEVSTKRCLRFYQVWNVTQCEKLKLPELDEAFFENSVIDRAEEINTGYSDKPRIDFGGNIAGYIQMFDMIVCPPIERFKIPEQFYASLWHEFGHSTGTYNRLNRFGEENDTRKEGYSREELVAEMTSAFLMAEIGLDSPEVIENHVAYIASWIGALKSDSSMVTWAAAKAMKAADYILGKTITKEVEVESEEKELVAV